MRRSTRTTSIYFYGESEEATATASSSDEEEEEDDAGEDSCRRHEDDKDRGEGRKSERDRKEEATLESQTTEKSREQLCFADVDAVAEKEPTRSGRIIRTRTLTTIIITRGAIIVILNCWKPKL